MASSSILAKIGLNSAGFKTGLAQCRMAASSFKKSVGGMFSGLGGQILGAFGLSAGVAGLGMLTRKAIETGSQISDMASHLRIGTTELQVLQSVARNAGVDMSKFEMALNNLNLRTSEACEGNDKYREAFERLGIDLKKFASLPMEQKLAAIANGYKKSGESLTSLSDISTLLGQKAGPQLLEVLDRISTEGMESLTESADLYCKSVAIKKHGSGAIITAQYEGSESWSSTTDSGENTIEVSCTMREEPIETHPKFKTWAGTPDNPAAGIFDENGKFVGWNSGTADGEVLAGVKSYLVPAYSASVGYISRGRPGLGGIGAIGGGSGLPSIGGNRQWMCVGISYSRLSDGKYKVSANYLLSGPNGWNRKIYG